MQENVMIETFSDDYLNVVLVECVSGTIGGHSNPTDPRRAESSVIGQSSHILELSKHNSSIYYQTPPAWNSTSPWALSK